MHEVGMIESRRTPAENSQPLVLHNAVQLTTAHDCVICCTAPHNQLASRQGPVHSQTQCSWNESGAARPRKPHAKNIELRLASLVCASFFCLIKIRLRCPCHGAPIIYRETSATDYAWQIENAQHICLPGFLKKVF